MGKDTSPSGAAVTTSQNEPWGPQQPYLTEGMREAARLYNQGPISYPEGDLVAGRTGDYLTGADSLRDFVGGEGYDALYGGASGALAEAFASPDVANNPYVTGMVDAAQDEIYTGFERFGLPGIRDSAIAAGQPGSTRRDVAETLGASEAIRLATNAGNQIRGAAYNTGVNDRMNAIVSGAPSVARLGMMPGEQLINLGVSDQDLNQRTIDADVQRELYDKYGANRALEDYMRLISGNYGGSSSTSQPVFGGDSLTDWIGAGASVAGLFI